MHDPTITFQTGSYKVFGCFEYGIKEPEPESTNDPSEYYGPDSRQKA
jgi:hypothetical protein